VAAAENVIAMDEHGADWNSALGQPPLRLFDRNSEN
jgi:hypothetical protein